MALKKGYRNTTLRPTVVAKLDVKWEQKKKDKPGIGFGTVVNDFIEICLQKEEFLARIAPALSSLGVQDNVLYIKDIRRPGRTAEVWLKDEKLYCELDDSRDCEHIHFAFGVPEVARLESIKRPR